MQLFQGKVPFLLSSGKQWLVEARHFDLVLRVLQRSVTNIGLVMPVALADEPLERFIWL